MFYVPVCHCLDFLYLFFSTFLGEEVFEPFLGSQVFFDWSWVLNLPDLSNFPFSISYMGQRQVSTASLAISRVLEVSKPQPVVQGAWAWI